MRAPAAACQGVVMPVMLSDVFEALMSAR